MIIKDAPWEMRNLGVEKKVFSIAVKDKSDDVLESIKTCTAEYQEMTVPEGNTEILMLAQDEGFRFVEMAIHMRKNLTDIQLPNACKPFAPHISYCYAQKDDIDFIRSQIRSGEMFTTDKIARDPYFGPQAAGKRYSFWFQDLVDNGAIVILSKYKGKTIGFGTYKDVGRNTYSGLLGGVFPEFTGEGLGFIPQYTGLMALKERGAGKVLGHVSSNNISVLKWLELLGFVILKTEYVLIKHL